MIKLVYIVRKRADLSAQAFHIYWLEKHGPLVRSFAKALHARKYVQSHTIAPEIGDRIAKSRQMGEGYDGITEVWWDSLDELNAGFGSPEGRNASQALAEDEAKFVDLEKSFIFLTEEHTIFDNSSGSPT
jgi:uncharacterized protein (TIGR02118 family)